MRVLYPKHISIDNPFFNLEETKLIINTVHTGEEAGDENPKESKKSSPTVKNRNSKRKTSKQQK